MDFELYFPIWQQLTNSQQEQLHKHMTERFVKKGTVIHGSSAECTGLLVVKQGQLRAYMISEDGKLRCIGYLTGICVCFPHHV